MAEKWPESVTPIITRYTLNNTFDLDKMADLYHATEEDYDIR